MDHLHDSNLLAIEGIELPDFVKVANEHPKFFAYSNGLESFFPIDTASNTYLSAVYFEKNAHVLNEHDFVATHDRILEALKLHNISYESQSHIEKRANENQYYSFEKLASEVRVFEQNYRHISPEERHEKAKEIRQRYEALRDADNSIPNCITKEVDDYSGSHLKDDWRNIIQNRSTHVDDDSQKEAYNELSKSEEPKELILKLLSMLDNKTGLHKYYDRGIDDPFKSLLTNSEPQKTKIIVMVVNGKHYSSDDVDKFNPLDLADRFGGDILKNLLHDKINYLKSAPEFVKVAVAERLDNA